MQALHPCARTNCVTAFLPNLGRLYNPGRPNFFNWRLFWSAFWIGTFCACVWAAFLAWLLS